MKRICLLIIVAVMSGCRSGRLDRTPIPAPPVAAVERAAQPDAKPGLPPVPPSPIEPFPPSPPLPNNTEDRLSGNTLEHAIETVNGQLEDAFFAYDHFDLSPGPRDSLRRDADLLRAIIHEFPSLRVVVEGHCDERGSAEYNLGLGDRRASSALEFLQQLGLSPAVFVPISYGKERPQCAEPSESCWSRNRRVHLAVRTTPTE